MNDISKSNFTDDDIVSIPLGETGVVTLNIKLNEKYATEIAQVLYDLTHGNLSRGMLSWLSNYGATIGKTMDVQSLFNALADLQITKSPIVSPLEVFSRYEKG